VSCYTRIGGWDGIVSGTCETSDLRIRWIRDHATDDQYHVVRVLGSGNSWKRIVGC
jgi:hypothetical protein